MQMVTLRELPECVKQHLFDSNTVNIPCIYCGICLGKGMKGHSHKFTIDWMFSVWKKRYHPLWWSQKNNIELVQRYRVRWWIFANWLIPRASTFYGIPASSLSVCLCPYLCNSPSLRILLFMHFKTVLSSIRHLFASPFP